MHYLITGHTGFKGSWLTTWLTLQGHQVSGISLDPVPGSLYEAANLGELVTKDLRLDIRNADEVTAAIQSINPDVVFHMAAQPLVRESYNDPRFTFETNAIGSLNVLEGVSKTKSIKAHVVITTDKVYRNMNQVAGYKENDVLGGDDPYSASKAMADILTHSWLTSFPGVATAVVRAGNVIGGGDVSKDRLLPDLINSYASGLSPCLRYPEAVRPWQHVIDCLNGYSMIAKYLIEGGTESKFNIGPDESSFVTVGEVANLVADKWGSSAKWVHDKSGHLYEAGLLALDASKAKNTLGWSDRLKFSDAINWTVDWEKKVRSGDNPRLVTLGQLERFMDL